VLRRHLAGLLGTNPVVAGLLLARARRHHGAWFVPSLVLFLVATVRPLAAIVPRRLRKRLILRFLAPMLDVAPAGLAYVTGQDLHLREPCEGLLQS